MLPLQVPTLTAPRLACAMLPLAGDPSRAVEVSSCWVGAGDGGKLVPGDFGGSGGAGNVLRNSSLSARRFEVGQGAHGSHGKCPKAWLPLRWRSRVAKFTKELASWIATMQDDLPIGEGDFPARYRGNDVLHQWCAGDGGD